MTWASAAITLFLLMDPLGNTPVFLTALRKLPTAQRRWATAREVCFALIVLMAFLLFGKSIMTTLNITPPALSTAGGVVLFIVAMRMIFPGRHGGIAEESGDDVPWLVPLAVPMMAGPSSMAFVTLLGSSQPARMWEWVGAILIAWGCSAAILMAADLLRPFLKDVALRAMERLMGMILVVIAVQMLMNGIALYLQGLKG